VGKRLLVPLAVLAIAFGGSSTALADPDGNQPGGVTDPGLLALITNDDVFSTADLSILLAGPAAPLTPNGNGTQHYGPYASGSTDSGTCGADWATETFDRDFTVKSGPGGTFTVVEQFKNGDFQTTEVPPTNPSPGACDSSDGTPPGTVDAGKTGSMHGYFIIPNVGPQTSTSPYCDAAAMSNTNCDTTTFINTHFAACYPGTCSVTTFFFHYAAGDQNLVEHEWKNASCDRGGNNGDIASANVGVTPPFVLADCP
jgi:hypothetical protein